MATKPNTRKRQTLVISAITLALLALLISILLITRNRQSDDTKQLTSSNNASQSNIPLNNNLSDTGIRLDNSLAPTPQDTLATLKASPAYQNARTDIPYAELFRNADNYKGQYVRYSGNVIQVLGESGNWNLRVNITKKVIGTHESWDDTVFIFSYSPERVIDKDVIEFTAYVNGTTTYKSTFGQDITIPSLTIYEHTLVGRTN